MLLSTKVAHTQHLTPEEIERIVDGRSMASDTYPTPEEIHKAAEEQHKRIQAQIMQRREIQTAQVSLTCI